VNLGGYFSQSFVPSRTEFALRSGHSQCVPARDWVPHGCRRAPNVSPRWEPNFEVQVGKGDVTVSLGAAWVPCG
jgi:hypothetical protein